VISRGTTNAQKTITTTLGRIATGIELDPPVVAVVGSVVTLSERLQRSVRHGKEGLEDPLAAPTLAQVRRWP
jgi:hypothetical protein